MIASIVLGVLLVAMNVAITATIFRHRRASGSISMQRDDARHVETKLFLLTCIMLVFTAVSFVIQVSSGVGISSATPRRGCLRGGGGERLLSDETLDSAFPVLEFILLPSTEPDVQQRIIPTSDVNSDLRYRPPYLPFPVVYARYEQRSSQRSA